MAHLPNELWLNIISCCEDEKDLWLSLRHVSHQLRACVEQYFAQEALPHLSVSLPLALPTYDARNPIRGEATFLYSHLHHQPDPDQDQDHDRVCFDLGPTKPEFYLNHFLGRWAGMKDVDGGWMRSTVVWILRLRGREVGSKIGAARAVSEGVEKDEARMEFEWKPTLTALFMHD